MSQRGSSDWSIPQFTDPLADGYTTVQHTSPATLRARFSFKDNVRPYFWCLAIDVSGDSLAPGDVVTIVLGDTGAGSRGIRAQSFQEVRHQFALDLDPTNSNDARRVAEHYLSIIPAVARRARIILASSAELHGSVPIFACGEDQWGNPILDVAVKEIVWHGQGRVHIDAGRLHFDQASQGYLTVTIESQGKLFTSRSNPIRSIEKGANQLLWGDMHAQTGETVGAGNEDEYFTFARDVARLDFTSHQGNDFQISDQYWDHLNEVTRKYHRDGEFVVFPGYEWSGNSPVGGDRNVWYCEEGNPIFRSSDWLIGAPVRDQEAVTVHDLFRLLKERVGSGKYMLGAHVGGRYAAIEHGFDADNGPLVEVVSCWGVFEWIIFDALRKGYRVGIVANSDGRKGRPGAEHPGALDFGIRGGLTAVFVPARTRQQIFAALLERHCYGTTGARIILDCSLNGRQMGDVLSLESESPLAYSVIGCDALERIELYRGCEIVACHWAPEFAIPGPSRRIRILWGGSQSRGRTRRIVWNGTVSVGREMKILQATPVCFDTPADGIEQSDTRTIHFRSRTTGDADGMDLLIEGEGELVLHCDRAHETFNTRALTDFTGRDQRRQGGLDAFVSAARYPESSGTMSMRGEFAIAPQDSETPYFIKVTQVDGEMAWASPFYVLPR